MKVIIFDMMIDFTNKEFKILIRKNKNPSYFALITDAYSKKIMEYKVMSHHKFTFLNKENKYITLLLN
ncbi:hypothetical protein [Tenacibaculum sp. AHE14PA]|uniref:hypothetical protein n=1 Tax=Tenacibaculum sp. AHE14PA TaxID=2745565 RepID=UPI001C4E71A0|nr:hypothetical protein [Tenacibaculum sp. AHE14PA]QXP72551.1 hypothetical protein H0I30_07540 [Tenacibaculum sp. AHE14PA]